jgi:foldase protein PrsA
LLCAVGIVVTLVAATGCNDDDNGLPDDAVARVGDSVITRADYERALKARGRTTDRMEKAVRSSVTESLIEDEWIRQEAEVREITVTQADVQKAVEKARETGFLSDEALERAELTMTQLLPSIRGTQLERKVTEDITERASSVSAETIAEYYRRHREELMVPERRDVRLVLTRTRARAKAARAALENGGSWTTVAEEYSLHGSRVNGGKVADLRKGPLSTPLVTTVFRTRQGVLSGPIRADDSSWGVFVVERIKPPFQASFERARDDIKDFLISRQRRQALDAFRAKYREMTTCAPGFEVPSCKNGPEQTDKAGGKPSA